MIDKKIIYNYNDSETYFIVEKEYWDQSAMYVMLYTPILNQKKRLIVSLDMLMSHCSCVSDPILYKALHLGVNL